MEILGDDEIGQILKKLTNRVDRKSCSRLCKQWRRVEAATRTMLTVLDVHFLHSFLPRYRNLLSLESGKGISDCDLELIAETCPALQTFNLNLVHAMSFTDVFEGPIRDMVTDEGICAIAAGCRDLRKVYLRRRRGLGNVGLKALVKSCRNIIHLDLGFCHKLTDQALEAIGVADSLETLILHGCSLITDKGLISLATGPTARTLKTLELCECDRITDLGVSCLQQLSCLRVLNLAHCGPRITDIGVMALQAISRLESINLSWLINVSDASLLAIAVNCQKLKEINLTGCESVTGDGIRGFSHHMSLQVMILDACDNVFSEDIEYTVFKCPTLEYLGLDREMRHWIPNGLLAKIEGHCRIEWL
eukprot:Gb_14523 [translate_table: standard]